MHCEEAKHFKATCASVASRTAGQPSAPQFYGVKNLQYQKGLGLFHFHWLYDITPHSCEYIRYLRFYWLRLYILVSRNYAWRGKEVPEQLRLSNSYLRFQT